MDEEMLGWPMLLWGHFTKIAPIWAMIWQSTRIENGSLLTISLLVIFVLFVLWLVVASDQNGHCEGRSAQQFLIVALQTCGLRPCCTFLVPQVKWNRNLSSLMHTERHPVCIRLFELRFHWTCGTEKGTKKSQLDNTRLSLRFHRATS